MIRGRWLVPLVLAALTVPAWAVRTERWTESPARLEHGEADGVAVTSDGTLFLAPRMTALGEGQTARYEAHVWSVASGSSGNVYLGTGPEGRVLEISPSGTETVLFTVDEPMVTALAVLPGGDVLAGTAPEGRVYRIAPDGTGQIWAETGERYVWALAPAADGSVFAATGEQGIVFRIEPSGETGVLFDSDEPHIVCLVARPDGSLVAGGAGRGLVYEIDPEGHAFVLHDDELPEVRALALEADGSLVAAMLGPPEAEPRPPAVKIQLPDGSSLAPASESVGELEEPTGPTVEGIIEGLGLPVDKPARGTRGRLVRISPVGEITELWSSRDEAPYSLALDPDGRPLFGTGEPGRLYRADGEGEVALLASLREAQVSGLLRTGREVVIATSNPASAYRIGRSPADEGEFLSRPLDAGAPSRWGSIRWSQDEGNGRAELYTRSGNSADPDGTWSGWGPAMTDSRGSPIVNPDGRFLQWRLRLRGADGARARVSDVTVSYAPFNRPPAIEDFRLHPPGAAISGPGEFRWNVSDPDGDAVEVVIEYAAGESTEWQLALSESSDSVSPEGDAGAWRSGTGTWETAELEQGPYRIRAVCDDRIDNYPGDGREVRFRAPITVIVDRTPPEIDAVESAGEIRVEVTDDHSAIGRLDVLDGDRVLYRARPEDGVCDSRRERFVLDLGVRGTPEELTLRAYDAAGNFAQWAPGAP